MKRSSVAYTFPDSSNSLRRLGLSREHVQAACQELIGNPKLLEGFLSLGYEDQILAWSMVQHRQRKAGSIDVQFVATSEILEAAAREMSNRMLGDRTLVARELGSYLIQKETLAHIVSTIDLSDRIPQEVLDKTHPDDHLLLLLSLLQAYYEYIGTPNGLADDLCSFLSVVISALLDQIDISTAPPPNAPKQAPGSQPRTVNHGCSTTRSAAPSPAVSSLDPQLIVPSASSSSPRSSPSDDSLSPSCSPFPFSPLSPKLKHRNTTPQLKETIAASDGVNLNNQRTTRTSIPSPTTISSSPVCFTLPSSKEDLDSAFSQVRASLKASQRIREHREESLFGTSNDNVWRQDLQGASRSARELASLLQETHSIRAHTHLSRTTPPPAFDEEEAVDWQPQRKRRKRGTRRESRK